MMFESGKLPPNYDYFRCVVNIPEDVQRVGEPSEAGEQVSNLRFFFNFFAVWKILRSSLVKFGASTELELPMVLDII